MLSVEDIDLMRNILVWRALGGTAVSTECPSLAYQKLAGRILSIWPLSPCDLRQACVFCQNFSHNIVFLCAKLAVITQSCSLYVNYAENKEHFVMLYITIWVLLIDQTNIKGTGD